MQWKRSVLVSLVILAISSGFYVWCTSVSDDMGGDSFVGLVFAIICTTFMFLAAVRFTLRRHARKRVVGELNAVLNWHVCFGVLAVVTAFLHAGGNYNPRSGTYALYAMIALVISGIIGRVFDWVMPRLITMEADKALTARGEDRIESISQSLQSLVLYNKQEVRGFNANGNRNSFMGMPPQKSGSQSAGGTAKRGGAALQTAWDLAYLSLDETPQELARPGALLPGAQAQMSELQHVQQALRREEIYRYVIRYWRVFHIVLAVVTVGLTLWHIEYALSLIIPALQKFGFAYLLPWP